MPLQSNLKSTFHPPWSWRRITYRIGLGLVGLLFSMFPLLGLFVLPDVKGTATDRALAGLLLTALMMFPAGSLAITVLSGDRLLFSTTPLTPRIYFRRQLGLNWPFHAVVGIAPAVAWLIWRFAPAEAWQGFHWTLLMVAEAVVAYYALLLAPVALFVHIFRFETPPRLSKRKMRRNRHLVAVAIMLFGVCFYFRHAILAGFRTGMSFALDSGTPATILAGLLSPGSILAVQGREPIPTIAGIVVVAWWTIMIATEVALLAVAMRRTKSRFEAAEVPYSDEDSPIASRQFSFSPIAADHLLQYVVSVDEREESEQPYSVEQSPEHWYVRNLPFVRPRYPRSGIRRNAINVAYRYPLLVLAFGYLTLAISAKIGGGSDEAIGTVVFLFAFYANLYSGIRWTWPLRISVALPLRLNHVAWITWKARAGYGVVCDAAMAELITLTLNAGWMDFILVFGILQVVSACGHIRSWLSILYGAGRKKGAWLYEAPLFSSPFMWLTALIFPGVEATSDLIPAMFAHAVFWLPYGLALVWLLNRDNDTSLPRVTSSYRPGIPGYESV